MGHGKAILISMVVAFVTIAITTRVAPLRSAAGL